MFNPTFYLDHSGKKSLYVQLYEYFKKEIENGNMPAGTKIPSVRRLASLLSLSRTTIENAYHQLSLEGYIYSKPKSGYFVDNINTNLLINSTGYTLETKNNLEKENTSKEKYLDTSCFDYSGWKKCYTNVLEYKSKTLLVSGDNQGEIELRKQISYYIYKARGVKCLPEQIVIGAGIQVLLGLLGVIFKSIQIKTIALENPGFNDIKPVLINQNFSILSLPLIDIDGNAFEILNSNQVDACYVNPSHQFPLGRIMPIKDRLELIKWAVSKNAYIIEDDYDSELRYSGRPVPSLQGLDSFSRVIYMGSFSTLLIPAIRISFMVLPKKLLKIYLKHKASYNQTSSTIEQLTLAEYIKEGLFERQLRRVRKLYGEKYYTIVNMIEKKAGSRIKIHRSDSGVNLLLTLENENVRNAFTGSLKNLGLLVKTVEKNMVLFQYATVPLDKMEEISNAICSIVSNREIC